MSEFVSFYAPVETRFVWTGWLYYPFGIKYTQYHFILAARRWKYPLTLVPQYVLIENVHPPHFWQKYPSFPDGQFKNLL